MLNLQFKISVGYSIFYATFFRELILKGVVWKRTGRLRGRPGSLAHIISTLTGQLEWSTLVVSY